MQSTVVNVLESAKKIGAKSVAMPAISVGMQGFPLDESCHIIIDQCIRWSLLQKHMDSIEGAAPNSIVSIKLMSWSGADIEVFKQEFKNIKKMY